MKVGDIIRVKDDHHVDPGMIGLVLVDFAKTPGNRGKAFRVLLSDGRVRPKMVRNVEVISEVGS